MSAEQPTRDENSAPSTPFMYWDRYEDGKIELSIGNDSLIKLHEKAFELEGVSLTELAQTDSNQTYKLVRLVLRSMIKEINTVTVDDSIIAQKVDSSVDERQSLAKTLFANLPDGDGPAFDFSLGLILSEEDKTLFGDEQDRVEVLEMRVEPPNLANF